MLLGIKDDEQTIEVYEYRKEKSDNRRETYPKFQIK